MTVMDTCGWGQEEKWVGSICSLYVSTPNACCVMDRKRMLSIMESVNWVCEEVLEERGWVSPLTVSLKEKKC